MSDIIVEIEHLYKEYRLGLIGYGTLREDMQSWWARIRGKEDPNSLLYSGDQSEKLTTTDHILALNDINLEVKKGERLGIIGANGAGKTTLLKILSRIASPTQGTARIKGNVASLIAVGTGFHSELTGRENVYLNGSILGLRKFEITQRFDEIVDFAGVGQFIDTPVKRYSSGMHVRLGFAVAAHLNPDVLIVDEVLAVGDAEFREKAMGKMKDVSEGEGRTILFVSHNMDAIKELCTNAILLDHGRIIKRASAIDTINHYLLANKIHEDLSHTVELLNHRNSQGPAKGLLLWAQLLNSNRKPSTQFHIGDDIIIIVCLERKLAESYVGLEVKLFSEEELPLSVSKSVNFKKIGFKEEESKIVVSVKLKDIRFCKGKYLISLRGRNIYGDQFELIENCMSFEIISGGRIEKEGTSENQKHGLVHISEEWNTEDFKEPIPGNYDIKPIINEDLKS